MAGIDPTGANSQPERQAQLTPVSRPMSAAVEVEKTFWALNPGAKDVSGDAFQSARSLEDVGVFAGSLLARIRSSAEDHVNTKDRTFDPSWNSAAINGDEASITLRPTVIELSDGFTTHFLPAWQDLHPEILDSLGRPQGPNEPGNGKLTKVATARPYPEGQVELILPVIEVMCHVDESGQYTTKVLWSTAAFIDAGKNLEEAFRRIGGQASPTSKEDADIQSLKLGNSRARPRRTDQEPAPVPKPDIAKPIPFDVFIDHCASYLAGPISSAIATRIERESIKLLQTPPTYIQSIEARSNGNLTIKVLIGDEPCELVVSKNQTEEPRYTWIDKALLKPKPILGPEGFAGQDLPDNVLHKDPSSEDL
ncbi:MAG: hypothetical protein J0M12_15605 [Deltaproteobacteria bacterium]|nr:hypothetical protein [Deltaproteobacteria bacterium]